MYVCVKGAGLFFFVCFISSNSKYDAGSWIWRAACRLCRGRARLSSLRDTGAGPPRGRARSLAGRRTGRTTPGTFRRRPCSRPRAGTPRASAAPGNCPRCRRGPCCAGSAICNTHTMAQVRSARAHNSDNSKNAQSTNIKKNATHSMELSVHRNEPKDTTFTEY